jgi:hypothetical protein
MACQLGVCLGQRRSPGKLEAKSVDDGGAYHGLRRLRWRGTVAKMEEAAAPIDPVRDMPIL